MKSKLLSKKAVLILVSVALAVIVAGAFVCGFLGFAKDSGKKDAVSIQVSGYLAQGDLRDPLEDFFLDKLKADGYSVAEVRYGTSYSLTDDILEFVLAGEADRDLTEYAAQLQTALEGAGIEGVDAAVITVSAHNLDYTTQPTPVWRPIVGAAVAVVLLFVYVAIRFRLGMGVTAFAMTLFDVLLTFALIALLRIPAGAVMAGVAVFVLLLSMLFESVLFGRIRMLLRDRDRDETAEPMTAADEVAAGAAFSRKGIFATAIALAAVCVVGGIVGLCTGVSLTWLMISALLGVLVCTFTATMISPAVYARIKTASDARRAEKSKYNYASEKRRAKAATADAAEQAE